MQIMKGGPIQGSNHGNSIYAIPLKHACTVSAPEEQAPSLSQVPSALLLFPNGTRRRIC